MDKYRKEVKNLADSNSSNIIPNSSIEHAAVLIENLFSHAHHSIRIFSGNLNPKVYNKREVICAADKFLSRDTSEAAKKLEIIVQNEIEIGDGDENKLYDLCKKYESICEIKLADEQGKSVESHFIVTDKTAYRLEPDRNKHVAFACFNNPDSACELDRFFEEMYARGTEYKRKEDDLAVNEHSGH